MHDLVFKYTLFIGLALGTNVGEFKCGDGSGLKQNEDIGRSYSRTQFKATIQIIPDGYPHPITFRFTAYSKRGLFLSFTLVINNPNFESIGYYIPDPKQCAPTDCNNGFCYKINKETKCACHEPHNGKYCKRKPTAALQKSFRKQVGLKKQVKLEMFNLSPDQPATYPWRKKDCVTTIPHNEDSMKRLKQQIHGNPGMCNVLINFQMTNSSDDKVLLGKLFKLLNSQNGKTAFVAIGLFDDSKDDNIRPEDKTIELARIFDSIPANNNVRMGIYGSDDGMQSITGFELLRKHAEEHTCHKSIGKSPVKSGKHARVGNMPTISEKCASSMLGCAASRPATSSNDRTVPRGSCARFGDRCFKLDTFEDYEELSDTFERSVEEEESVSRHSKESDRFEKCIRPKLKKRRLWRKNKSCRGWRKTPECHERWNENALGCPIPKSIEI